MDNRNTIIGDKETRPESGSRTRNEIRRDKIFGGGGGREGGGIKIIQIIISLNMRYLLYIYLFYLIIQIIIKAFFFFFQKFSLGYYFFMTCIQSEDHGIIIGSISVSPFKPAALFLAA